MNTAVVARPNFARRTLALGAVWVVAYFTARGFLELDTLETWQRVTIALAPVPIFAGFLWAYVGVVRSMDELERKIHLEALGIAFSVTLLLLTTLALMQRAVNLSFEDWSYAHVWFYLPIFYLGAIGFTSRRYQAEEDEA
jgi:hypothetical protein